MQRSLICTLFQWSKVDSTGMRMCKTYCLGLVLTTDLTFSVTRTSAGTHLALHLAQRQGVCDHMEVLYFS